MIDCKRSQTCIYRQWRGYRRGIKLLLEAAARDADGVLAGEGCRQIQPCRPQKRLPGCKAAKAVATHNGRGQTLVFLIIVGRATMSSALGTAEALAGPGNNVENEPHRDTKIRRPLG
jgi:hypothetical protein